MVLEALVVIFGIYAKNAKKPLWFKHGIIYQWLTTQLPHRSVPWPALLQHAIADSTPGSMLNDLVPNLENSESPTLVES